MYRDWQFLWSDMPSFAKRFFTIFVGRGVLLQIFLTMTFFIGKASRFIFWFIFFGGVDIVPKIWQLGKKEKRTMPWIIFTMTFFIAKVSSFIFSFSENPLRLERGRGTRFPGKRRLLTRKFPEIFQIPAMDYTRLATWSARSRSWKCRNYGGAGEGKTLNFLKKTLNPAKQTNSLGIQHGQRFSHSENTICNRNFCPVLLFSS